ncbi:hypothetical protein QL285_026762 [Trifolium repens]|nr:hypothetical protein QL285_026762 [Trifolium repens]
MTSSLVVFVTLSTKEYIAEDHARIGTRTADDIVVGLLVHRYLMFTTFKFFKYYHKSTTRRSKCHRMYKYREKGKRKN